MLSVRHENVPIRRSRRALSVSAVPARLRRQKIINVLVVSFCLPELLFLSEVKIRSMLYACDVRMYVCMHASMHACMYVCVRACVCVCAYVCVCVYACYTSRNG